MPSFPAPCSVQALLRPKEIFGEAQLTGKLVVSPGGHKVEMEPDMWHGGIVKKPGGRFSRLLATGSFFDVPFRLEGNVAIVEGTIDSEASLKRCIHLVGNDLPAFLSAALHGPVSVTDVFGTIGDVPYEVEVKGTFESVLKTIDAKARVEDTFKRLAELPAVGAERVFAAYRYLNHVRWLAYVESHPLQFIGEQLLNLNKAVEVLIQHSSRDDLRDQLRNLGLREEAVQLVASLGIIRNEVDVGHSAIELLTGEEHLNLHRFIVQAIELVRWLVEHVTVLSNTGRFEPKAVTPSKGKRETMLAQVGQLLDKVNPLHPETLLEPT